MYFNFGPILEFPYANDILMTSTSDGHDDARVPTSVLGSFEENCLSALEPGID